MRGSKSGLFVPVDLNDGERLLICEGPTDTAAALELGLDAIGRPSCNGAIEMTARAARGRSELIVVADNDDVGIRGAMKLADTLALHCRVKIVVAPSGIKDLRSWLCKGLSSEQLEAIIDNTDHVTVKIL